MGKPTNWKMSGAYPFFFNARNRAALLMTKGFKFSPMALQQRRKRNLSWGLFPPLYVFLSERSFS
jgi:hypothetical protein